MPFNLQRPAVSVNRNADAHIRRRQHSLALVRPFYKTQAVIGKVVTNTQKLQLFRIGQAVKVKMINLALTQLVGFDQRESRAFYRTLVTSGANQSAAEGGLAGPQVTAQPDTAAPVQCVADICSQALHGLITLYMHFQGHHISRRFR